MMEISEYLPDGERRRRIPLKEILVIEEKTFQKVAEVLNREFTAEQEKIVKALLFFLKRGVDIELKNSNEAEDPRYFKIFFEDKEIGSISYDEYFKTIWASDVFDLDEELKGKGYGIAIYLKTLIQASLNGNNLHSSFSAFSEALDVWERLTEVGLVEYKNEMLSSVYYFKNLSFLTEKDFEVIDKILKN